jgi:hypothetical protein
MSDALNGQAAPEAAAIAPAQTAAEPTNTMDVLTQTMGKAYDKIHPPRSEEGKFAPKEPAEAKAAEVPAEAKIPDQTQTQTPEPASPAIEAPVSWSAEMKAKWATLPPDVQAYALQRETEAHKRISELGQTAKTYEPVRNVLEKHTETFRKYGVDASTGIDQLMTYFAQSESNPRAFIENFARSKGIDLSNSQPTDQSAYVRSLEERVNRAEQLAREAHSNTTAWQKSEQDKAMASLASIVEAFSKDKPDFAEVENDIFAQLQAINAVEPALAPEKKLEKAYDAARWANPTIRDRLLSEQRKAEETKRTEEAKKKADEAKKSASLNVKSGQGASPAKKGSWEQTLRDVGERLAS